MQNILPYESNKYLLKIENFEGPLDLLCHLIDKDKMDICDIKISEIAEQYIQYINEMEKKNLEITSEFLIMASTLVYLKSKKLLPVLEEDDEKELTEEELLYRIIEYRKYKENAKKLIENFEENAKKFYKIPEDIKLPKQHLEVIYQNTLIPEIYEKIINKNKSKINKNAENIKKIAIIETYTVGSKVKVMFKELIRYPSFVFNKLFSQKKCNNLEIITAFSGLLELSRRSKVSTSQNETFGDIVVEKRKKYN